MSDSANYEVVIVGGGPAGAAAAITLARAGRRVLLAEALAQPAAFKIGESLPPAARPLLRELGAEAAMLAGGHLPSAGFVAAWGDAQAVERDFIREHHGSGWHLDRPRFDAELRATAAAAGADVRLDCAFVRWRRSDEAGRWDLRFARREGTLHVATPWVIDATGRRALVATHYGAPAVGEDDLVAFCLVLPACEGAADTRTFIEAAEDGWWYFTGLPGGRRLVAFCTDSDLPAAAEMAVAARFARRLAATQHLRQAVGDPATAAVERVRRFPAGSVTRRAFGGEGWLAVGDATLAFDPLSSQGLIHALHTGLRGAQTILALAAGDTAALGTWHERLRAIHAGYRRHFAQCYAAERRWPDAPFWQRRHRMAVSILPPAAPPPRFSRPFLAAAS